MKKFLPALLVLLLPLLASAETVSWNTVFNGTLCSNGGFWACANQLTNPNISVLENTQVINAVTGAPIACGSTVPQGTQLLLKFVPHIPQDVYWFGTGGSEDSPYGEWVPSAQVVSTCTPQNNITNSFPYIYPANGVQVFVDLSVNPPQESMTGLAGLNCTPTGSGAVCDTSKVAGGTYRPTFNWDPTYGHFYGYYTMASAIFGVYGCTGGIMGVSSSYFANLSSNDPGNTYTMNVPAQTLQCPITIAASSGTSTPPTVTVTDNVSASAASCQANNVPSYDISGTSSTGSKIRYGISWDDSGIVEQWVPTTGYVDSGTSVTITQAGQGGTFEVIAQDQQGYASGWISHSPAACPGSCQLGFVQQNGTCVFSKCPTNYTYSNGQCVLTSCPAKSTLMATAQGPVCVYSGENSGGGTPSNVIIQLPVQLTQWKVTPQLVRSGETTKVSWNVLNAASCAIAGTNGDRWSVFSAAMTSKPITGQTIFKLSCLGLDGSTVTKSSTVNIIPSFQEH